MALKLDPVRLLIADDVGVGKTIKACLVARELLDRGEIERLAVLCPPHLAEQWQIELHDKFRIDAELVLPSTAGRLERYCRIGQSLFELYPHVVVSMDFIKSDRRRDEFARTCPDLVIIDEAHTCALYEGRGGRHQRHQLVRRLAIDPARHLILVTATLHSRKEEAFRSLLGFLDPEFANLPDKLLGPEHVPHRRRLAAHFIQRRRADIRHFLHTKTPFPERKEREATYTLSAEYRRLFDRVLRHTHETVRDPAGSQQRQRVRWWSALALLRSIGSSPAAAAATLRNRSSLGEAESPAQVDNIGRHLVFDVESEDLTEGVDVTLGSHTAEETTEAESIQRRLLDMAREAEKLEGEKDTKLLKAVTLVQELLQDGYRPILFCRFIATADYVAREMRKRLPDDVEVASVTDELPAADREARVLELAKAAQRVLVCTDCLSEGINLQDHFDAIMHYDLLWRPTRHEQREGRVDRYEQPRDTVRILTYYGNDNSIDGIVLDILIRKHKTIRNSPGISVPVLVDTDTVVEAIFEGLLLREQASSSQLLLPVLEEYLKPKREDLHTKWDDAANRERRSRTMFAQESISSAMEDLARELREVHLAVGSANDVATFTVRALRSYKAIITQTGKRFRFDFTEIPRALHDLLGQDKTIAAQFELPVDDGVAYMNRPHPLIESLATYVMDTAIDPITDGIARRAGARAAATP